LRFDRLAGQGFDNLGFDLGRAQADDSEASGVGHGDGAVASDDLLWNGRGARIDRLCLARPRIVPNSKPGNSTGLTRHNPSAPVPYDGLDRAIIFTVTKVFQWLRAGAKPKRKRPSHPDSPVGASTSSRVPTLKKTFSDNIPRISSEVERPVIPRRVRSLNSLIPQ